MKLKDLPEGTFFRVIGADPTTMLGWDPSCRFKKQLGENFGSYQANCIWMWCDTSPMWVGSETYLNPDSEVEVLPVEGVSIRLRIMQAVEEIERRV